MLDNKFIRAFRFACPGVLEGQNIEDVDNFLSAFLERIRADKGNVAALKILRKARAGDFTLIDKALPLYDFRELFYRTIVQFLPVEGKDYKLFNRGLKQKYGVCIDNIFKVRFISLMFLLWGDDNIQKYDYLILDDIVYWEYETE